MKKNIKRIFSAFLALALVLVPVTNAQALTDIEGHWAQDYIEWADTTKIVQGYEDETFKPEGNITNAEFYRMINQAAHYVDKADINFADVNSDDWFYEEVQKGVAAGYLEDSNENLNPKEAISRDEVARIIAEVYELDSKEDKVADFSDGQDVTNKGQVGALVDLGILEGYPEGDFRPANNITRAEAAKTLYTTLEKLGVQDIYLGDYKDDLVILHVNDVHGHVEANDEQIGAANFKNVIDYFRENYDKVLVVDAGDAIQGTNFASLSDGADVIKVMNLMNLDAFAPGNHEFDYSKEDALKAYEDSNFKWYASNIFYEDTGELVFDAGEVIDVDGLKVGIFGLDTPETKYKADPRNTEGLRFPDTVEENAEIAQKEADRLRAEGAEIVIMITHFGVDPASEVKSTDMADNVTGVDLIIDGHSHTLLENGLKQGNSFVVQAGESLEQIGLTTISKDKDIKSRMITKGEAIFYGQDEEVAKLIEDLSSEQDKVLGQELGTSGVLLDGERAHVRAGETNLGNLITDAMRKESGADVVITNGGGIRASIEAGPVTVGDVFTVLPFGNAMTVIEVTGQDIIDALNHGVKDYPNAAGQFPHVSGMSYEIVVGEPSTVTNVKVAGEDIDLNKTYTLATNDFMAVGGDGYTMFEGKHQTALYGSLAKIVEEYITELTAENPQGFTYEIEGRITEAGSNGQNEEPADQAA